MTWRSGKPTVESGRTLPLGPLLKARHLRGSYSWSNARTGQITFRLVYLAELEDDRGIIQLCFRAGGHGWDQTIGLAATPQPFGGVRWWFVCPMTGKRVVNLYMPAGASGFASRQAFGLAYRSQRRSRQDRCYTRCYELRAALGNPNGRIGDHVPKPPRMHWSTYDRKLRKLRDVEAGTLGHLLQVQMRLHERLGPRSG